MVLKGLLKYVKKTLDHQVPKKQKFVHGNHLPFYEKKKQYIGLGFAINISKIKLTKTKESMQNNKLHCLTKKNQRKNITRVEMYGILLIGKRFGKECNLFYRIR